MNQVKDDLLEQMRGMHPIRSAGGRKPSVDLIADLKKMQQKRHTLDIVNDLLHDRRVKVCGWMRLDSPVSHLKPGRQSRVQCVAAQ